MVVGHKIPITLIDLVPGEQMPKLVQTLFSTVMFGMS